MLKLTKTGIGLLTRQYRSVLRKCWLINVGLWQAMGDAVSKAVSVPARLVASLLSGGALNGEAFNVLDEILLSRLFERKLSSLTAVGLTIAALALPSKAEAAELPRQIINAGQTVNSISGSFSNHVSSNTGGYFISNAGTIKSANVVMQNNQSSSTGGLQSLIDNDGTINSLTGSAIGNTWTSTMGTESDDGVLLYSYGVIGTINMTVQNNSLQSTNVNSSAPAGLLWFRNTVDHIYGTYSGNTLTANGIYGGYYNWGLIVIDKDVTDINATISNNTVNNTNASMSVLGGALTNNGGSIGSIISSFTGNSAQSGHNAFGGAIYNVSTITSIGSATNHATFTGNYAKGSFEVKGGAIYNTGTITNIYADFNTNRVVGTAISDAVRGGAIFNTGKINLISGNSSGNYVDMSSYGSAGGGFLSSWGSGAEIGTITGTYTNNYVKANTYAGGAVLDIYSASKVGTISGTFSNNTATAETNLWGGVISVYQGSQVDTISANFNSNSATAKTGYAIGGVIHNQGSGNLIKNINSNFDSNSASAGSDAWGGAIFNSSSINSISGTFSGNWVKTSSTSLDGGKAAGGAIFNASGATISSIVNSTFSENRAYANYRDYDGAGGAIYNDGTISLIQNTLFENNISDAIAQSIAVGGAAISNHGVITAIIDTDFVGNKSLVLGNGGAIRNTGTMNIYAQTKNVYFDNNTTSVRGGAIAQDGGTLTIEGQNGYKVIFRNNSADYASWGGGAIQTTTAGSTSIKNADFIGNTHTGIGGAIYSHRPISFSGTNTFTDNRTGAALTYLNDIYNDSTINITGGTTQLNSGYDGTASSVLNISSGATFDLNENNNQRHTSNLGVLTNSGTFRLGVDIQHPTSGTTGSADLFTIASGSSGSILIDAINEIGGVSGRPSRTGTFTYQVLSGSGVTLAVDTALRNAWASRKITTGPTTPDTIAATTNWGTTYYYRTPYEIINGTLNTNGNYLVYTVSSINPSEDLEKMGDTLALVTAATNNASRIFSTTDATAEYLLSTNLGAVNAVYKNLSINGTVSGNNRSTLNLGNYNGFVLDSSDDNLSLNNVKVSGGTDYSVNLANSGSNLNVANVIMDSTAAPITGAGNVEFTGTNEINTKVLNTGTTTVSSGTTDFNDEVAGFTVSAPATVSIAADDITAETTNNGTLELEGGNVSTKLMGTGRMKLMSGNVRLLSSTPPATTGSLSFGSSSDYVDSIATAISDSSHSATAIATADAVYNYLSNNYYTNVEFSMAKNLVKVANDNNFTTFNCAKEA